MFCSTIIPTIGRTTLARAVTSVLEQELPDSHFEIIVVNDSGKPLAKGDWQGSSLVRVIDTAGKRERSVSRNTGAAIAKGGFFHFLDDDDWIEPGTLQRFYEFSQKVDAAWLYGNSKLVDKEGNLLNYLEHGLQGNCFIQVLAGEWIPLQASLIKAEPFFKVGGFNTLISGPEDIDLLRRICLIGEVAGIPDISACIVRNDPGTTTDYDVHPEISRWAREAIFNEPSVFGRLRDSSSSAYWRGRVVRAYLTSFFWNLQHKRGFAASSRAFHALAGVLLSGFNVFTPDFWKAITQPYISKSYTQGRLAVGLTP